MGKYWIHIPGLCADGSPHYVEGVVDADSLADAERRGKEEAEAIGIIDIDKYNKVIKPYRSPF